MPVAPPYVNPTPVEAPPFCVTLKAVPALLAVELSLMATSVLVAVLELVELKFISFPVVMLVDPIVIAVSVASVSQFHVLAKLALAMVLVAVALEREDSAIPLAPKSVPQLKFPLASVSIVSQLTNPVIRALPTTCST